MQLSFALILATLLKLSNAQSSVTIATTSGKLQGIEQDGGKSFLPVNTILTNSLIGPVMSFKGVVSYANATRSPAYLKLYFLQRFGQPPTGDQRWTPPVAFVSDTTQNTTVLGPACVQQFPFAVAALNELLFNNPQDPPAENEDCLFL